MLLANGGDPNLKDENGNNPLHMAAERGHKATMKLLLDAGANPDEEDAEGKAPLYIAAEQGTIHM